MSDTTPGIARPPSAWDNRAWVRALMLFPDEPRFLEYVRESGPGAELPLLFTGQWEKFANDSRAGQMAGLAAGAVLACLYFVSEGCGITFPRKPGLRTAFKLAAAHGKLTNQDAKAEGNPNRIHAGSTRIAAAFRERRSVVHLWAAVVLHWYGLMGSRCNEGVLKWDEGHGALLGTARSVQTFALGWRDPRTGAPAQLLGPAPWLVPDGFHLAPAWPLPSVQQWVLDVLEPKGRRPARGSAT